MIPKETEVTPEEKKAITVGAAAIPHIVQMQILIPEDLKDQFQTMLIPIRPKTSMSQEIVRMVREYVGEEG
jgi:hypothetical protein